MHWIGNFNTVNIAQLVEYRIVAPMVIGSSPIIYPVWISIFRKNNQLNTLHNNLCKNYKLNDIININKIIFKYKNINVINLKKNIKKFIQLLACTNQFFKIPLILKNIIKNDNFKNIINLYYHYTTNSKNNYFYLLSIKNLKCQPIALIIKYQSQLYSCILKNSKLMKSITNGIFLKKLELEKCQKKNDKLSLLNLKECYNIATQLKQKENDFFLINIKNTNTKIFKILNFFKKKIQSTNTLIYFTPSINYSYVKFKKIKSIKRKLTKKYNKLTKN